MRQMDFDRTVLRDPAWWQWLATTVLLAGHLGGWPACLSVAVGLCLAFAGFDVLSRGRPLRAMGVQIRVGYALLLIIGTLPGLAWIHLVQLVGVLARITIGYCLMERLLLMAPWNRPSMLTWPEAVSILKRPGSGGLWRRRDAVVPSACSLQSTPAHQAASRRHGSLRV